MVYMRMLNVHTSLEKKKQTQGAINVYGNAKFDNTFTINLHMKILNVHSSLENAVTRNCSY